MRRHDEGFTLLELLVSMALIGIVLAAVFNFFSQSSAVSAQASGRADLQQEVLNAQQLIAGKLKEAWYVYPPRTAAADTWQLTATALTQNPVRTGNTWKTATSVTPNEPLLAMILPPETGSTTYRFLAYYPVLRSVWVAGTDADGWRNPGADTLNANTWVLAEYRKDMPTTFAPTALPTTPPDMPPSGQANILADYLAPTIVTSGFTTSTSTYTMFTYSLDSTGNVSGITLRLATTRNMGSKVLRLPGATGTYDLTVYPTNLGKVAAN